MASAHISMASYAQLLRRNTNFRRLLLAQIVSELGDWFYSVAIYSLLLEFTGRAQSVAFAVVLQLLPQALIGPAAAVITDRFSRKTVMIVADLLRVVTVSSMLLVRRPEMVWLVYPLLFIETLMAGLFEPARTAVLPGITTEPQLIVANTLSATTWSVNLALGSTLGGIVAALAGRETVFILNALSFAASAALIWGMKFSEPHVQKAAARRGDWLGLGDIAQGIAYVRTDLRLLATVFVKSGLLFVGTALVLFPIMGERLFPLHSTGLSHGRAAMLSMSLLMGARGVGALIGPLISAPWVGTSSRRLRWGILLGFLFAGGGYVLLSMAPTLALACAAIILSHIGGSNIWVFSTTMLQMMTEDDFRGRVFAAEQTLATLAIAVTAYLSGVAVDHGISPRAIAGITGALVLVPAMMWAFAIYAWKDKAQATA